MLIKPFPIDIFAHIQTDKLVHPFEHAKGTHTSMSLNIVFRQA